MVYNNPAFFVSHLLSQALLHEKIFELSGEQEKLQSTNALLDSQVLRLKGEKKQLKAYALQLKEKSEKTEAALTELESKKNSLENLLAEIAPLSQELRNQIKILENMKNKYVRGALSSSNGLGLSEELVEATDVTLFSANNSADSADMLSEFAGLKGFLAKATQNSPVKPSNSTVENDYTDEHRDRVDSDDIFESMKNKFRNFGDAMLEVEEKFDKMLR